MFSVAVPYTSRPFHSWPKISPLRTYVRFFLPGALVRTQLIGPTNQPVKIATGVVFDPVKFFAHLPTPITSNVETPSPPLKVPPYRMEPVARTPVVKLTIPRECPEVAAVKPQVISCDPIEVMVDTPIVPSPPVPAIPEMLSPRFC